MPLLDKQRTKKSISVSVNVKIALLQVFGKDTGSKYIACKYLPAMFCFVFFLQWEGKLANSNVFNNGSNKTGYSDLLKLPKVNLEITN